jgi:hypothetical protein
VVVGASVSSSASANKSVGSRNVSAIPLPRKPAVVHNAASPSISEADENLMDSILNGL